MARRGGSPVFVGPGRFAGIKGVEKLQRKIAALPDAVVAKVKPAIEKGADRVVDKFKAIAPVSDLEAHPGQLRDSAHREPGRHELSVRIVVDARDPDGRFYAAHVEYGHKTPKGTHVPAVPAFWPAYNVTKKSVRSLIARAMRAGVKDAAALGGSTAE